MKIALNTPGDYSLSTVAGMPAGGPSLLQNIIKWGMTLIMITAAVLTIIFLVWGGIEWISSGGNKDKIQAAKKKITYAVIGLIITLGSFFIVNMIGYLFNVNFFF